MLILSIILVILVIAAVMIGYFTGFLRIEKVEVKEEGTEPDFDLAAQEGEESPLDDGVDLKDKMDLEYFGDEVEPSAPMEITEGNMAQYDALSDFKTGRSYLIDAQKTLTDAKADGTMYAAIRFDFDRFRFINSLKGFSIGDYVLTRMSQEMSGVFPAGAQLTRISADHFAVVLPLVDENMFQEIADRLGGICDKIRSDMGIKSALRISLGAAVTENLERDYDVSVLLHKANLARYCIKTSRTEKVKLFEDSIISTHLFGESAMEDYNENQYDEEFVVYYVPEEDTTLHKIRGCEALVRWTHEVDNEQSFPLSISKSTIPTNGTKVVYQVCRAMGRWRKAGKEIVPISVSLPITDLFKEDLDEFLAKCLSEFQLEPKMLAIVIDAPTVRLDWSAVSRQMKRLRDIGVEIGVEGIDVGYTSLEFLAGLPINFVRFHRSFAYEVHTDPLKLELARKINDAAKAMNYRTVFEGVDSQEQSVALENIGARMVQGLCCGRPQQWENFSEGLLDYVEKQKNRGDVTVIIDDAKLNKGDFKLF